MVDVKENLHRGPRKRKRTIREWFDARTTVAISGTDQRRIILLLVIIIQLLLYSMIIQKDGRVARSTIVHLY